MKLISKNKKKNLTYLNMRLPHIWNRLASLSQKITNNVGYTYEKSGIKDRENNDFKE